MCTFVTENITTVPTVVLLEAQDHGISNRANKTENIG